MSTLSYHRKCQCRGKCGQKSQNLVNIVCVQPIIQGSLQTYRILSDIHTYLRCKGDICGNYLTAMCTKGLHWPVSLTFIGLLMLFSLSRLGCYMCWLGCAIAAVQFYSKVLRVKSFGASSNSAKI